MYPETKGVPLEEMDAVFGEGSSPLLSLEIHLMQLCSLSAEGRDEDDDDAPPRDPSRAPLLGETNDH